MLFDWSWFQQAQSRSYWSVIYFTHPFQEQPPEYFRVCYVESDQDCQEVQDHQQGASQAPDVLFGDLMAFVSLVMILHQTLDIKQHLNKFP